MEWIVVSDSLSASLGRAMDPRSWAPSWARRLLILVVAVALLTGAGALVAKVNADPVPVIPQAAPVPPGATWTEHYLRTPDGLRLHADVLRPSRLPADAKTPVIVSIGPYFNHSGQTGPLGPLMGVGYQPVGLGRARPSDRFYDLVVNGKLMERGYTFVMVDLRGFGGSQGCLDWVGPGEQSDVKTAVEWAAGQPWSTGKVGLYGKSYDGVTGLVGAALAPRGLEAVVSQEPVYDMYRYLYSNRVRYNNSLATPALYDGIAGSPGMLLGDRPSYLMNSVNDLQRPGCPALNWLDQQDSDHGAKYWRDRDLIAKARGSKVPVLLTQGFLEPNTKPDGAFDFYRELAGPKRAWFGMWDHVRGGEKTREGRLKIGRDGWFDEVMRWYDHYLKDESADKRDPSVAVQTSDGSWRAERTWPPADAKEITVPLRPGGYLDTGLNNGTNGGGSGVVTGDGIWTISPPLEHDAHLAGVPEARLKTEGLAAANVVVNVYDIAPDHQATLVSRGTSLRTATPGPSFPLLGNDWLLPAGHRIGVLVTSSNKEWWRPVSTALPVRVLEGSSVELPFLACRRSDGLPGKSSVFLDDYRKQAPFDAGGHLANGTRADFPLPGALRDCH